MRVKVFPGPWVGPGRRLRLVLLGVVVPLMAATFVALGVLWPRSVQSPPSLGVDDIPGRVVAVHEVPCPPDVAPVDTPTGLLVTRCGTVDVELTDGPLAGSVVTTSVPGGPGAPTVRVGEDVLVSEVVDPGDPNVRTYDIVDHQRAKPLFLLVLVFALAAVAFGRWRGLAALVGLAVSFAVLLLFVVPAIMHGQPPLYIAIVGAAAIMFAVLYLTHGISVNTTVAVLGTLASLIITGVAATLAASATYLTGFAGEDSFTLAVFYVNVDLRGLLLAGIIIGSLGVLDDVTVTQAVTVSELHAANPSLSRLRLFRSASRVGRAHIASVINTLVLAYAGASLPLLLLIYASGSEVGSVVTGELVSEEIVRSVVGSLGLIAAVPLTTALATLVVASRPGRAATRRPVPIAEHGAAALVADRRAISAPWGDGG